MTLPELLARQKIFLAKAQVAQLERLAQELLRWNQRHNLTAITAMDQVYEKHLVDSLTLFSAARSASRLLDLGSGAGFPALPLKIACPNLSVVTIEAVAKKVAFQRHAARKLGLGGYTAVHGRAEVLSQEKDFRGRFDLVTARALGDLPMLVALAKPFLATVGRLIAMKGPETTRELVDCGERLAADGWQVRVQWFALPVSGAERCLITLQRKDG